MRQGAEMASNKVQLYSHKGETSIFIDAEVIDSGDLVLSGQDVGKAPREVWGDADYEYWVRVPAEHKDGVLLALVEKVYGGNRSAISDFQAFLKERGIPSTFQSWV
jgi:hypothetical protein